MIKKKIELLQCSLQTYFQCLQELIRFDFFIKHVPVHRRCAHECTFERAHAEEDGQVAVLRVEVFIVPGSHNEPPVPGVPAACREPFPRGLR